MKIREDIENSTINYIKKIIKITIYEFEVRVI
jgi:hypothetical protein